MDSCRELALARLPPALAFEAVAVGMAARMSDDDPSWLVIAASLQLGPEHLRQHVASGVAAAFRQGHRWTGAAFLALVGWTLLALGIGVWAGAHGWIQYQRSELATIERRVAAAEAAAPPAWFVRWGEDSGGRSVGFARAASSHQVEVYDCTAGTERGVCFRVLAR